nr:holin [uncultured Anaerostipes sp.]
MKKYKAWAKAAGIRAVKTMAQTAVAMLPAAATITAVDWKTVAGTAALAGVASLLTSVKGLPELKTENETGKEGE